MNGTGAVVNAAFILAHRAASADPLQALRRCPEGATLPSLLLQSGKPCPEHIHPMLAVRFQ
jgi:hypothetical protein